jgi:hypothetical protein
VECLLCVCVSVCVCVCLSVCLSVCVCVCVPLLAVAGGGLRSRPAQPWLCSTAAPVRRACTLAFTPRSRCYLTPCAGSLWRPNTRELRPAALASCRCLDPPSVLHCVSARPSRIYPPGPAVYIRPAQPYISDPPSRIYPTRPTGYIRPAQPYISDPPSRIYPPGPAVYIRPAQPYISARPSRIYPTGPAAPSVRGSPGQLEGAGPPQRQTGPSARSCRTSGCCRFLKCSGGGRRAGSAGVGRSGGGPGRVYAGGAAGARPRLRRGGWAGGSRRSGGRQLGDGRMGRCVVQREWMEAV